MFKKWAFKMLSLAFYNYFTYLCPCRLTMYEH